jgi:hypothetical protein
MRLAISALVTGAACLALTGCVGITDPATNVASTSARLNAHGHTDATSARYSFRYDTDPAALSTTVASRTPRRGPVPPHVPAGGGDVAFSETVTGLEPGRTYFYEVCGEDAVTHPDVCGGVQSFFTTPTSAEDTAQGGFKPFVQGINGGGVDAASGPAGEHADGSIDYTRAGTFTRFSGRVTCLAVSGHQAAVGAVGRLTLNGGGDGGSESFLLTVVDLGPLPPPGQPPYRDDTIGIVETPGTTAPDCASASFAHQQNFPVTSVTVHDAP